MGPARTWSGCRGCYAETRWGGRPGSAGPRRRWLDDVDGGFYVASYLRAWALEARWRAHLRERFGERWFNRPEAGEWLTGLWRQGQRLRADELLAEALGEELRFDSLAAGFLPAAA